MSDETRHVLYTATLKHKKVNVSKNCREVTYGSAEVFLSGGDDGEILVCGVCFITYRISFKNSGCFMFGSP